MNPSYEDFVLPLILGFAICFLAWHGNYNEAIIAGVVALGSALKTVVKKT